MGQTATRPLDPADTELPQQSSKFVRAFGGLFFTVSARAWRDNRHRCEPLGRVPHTYRLRLDDGIAIVTCITQEDIASISETYSVGRFVRGQESDLLNLRDDVKIFQVIHFALSENPKSPPTLNPVTSLSTQEGASSNEVAPILEESEYDESDEEAGEPGLASRVIGWVSDYVHSRWAKPSEDGSSYTAESSPRLPEVESPLVLESSGVEESPLVDESPAVESPTLSRRAGRGRHAASPLPRFGTNDTTPITADHHSSPTSARNSVSDTVIRRRLRSAEATAGTETAPQLGETLARAPEPTVTSHRRRRNPSLCTPLPITSKLGQFAAAVEEGTSPSVSDTPSATRKKRKTGKKSSRPSAWSRYDMGDEVDGPPPIVEE